jgi:iron complex outermembrane recepter protein
MRSSSAQNTYDAIKNVPGVTQADAKAGGGSDNLQIRGIHLDSATGYRLDGGLPMNNSLILETEDKEQVQVLKGAGALEFGIASPAGIINYVLKRATKAPITAVSLSGTGFGQSIGTLDLGRSFGANQQFGVRVNLAGGDAPTYVRDGGGTRWLGAMTADWTTKRAKVRFDYEKFGINFVEQTTLLQNKPGAGGTITLPRMPDPFALLSGDWARAVGTGQNISTRGDYDAGHGISFSAEIGRSDADRPRRDVSQFGTYNLSTGKGTETVTLIQDQRYVNTYEDIEAKFRTTHAGPVENVFTVGFTRNERLFNNPVNGQATYTQYLYAPVPLAAPQFPTGPIVYLPQNSYDYDYYFSDSVVLFTKLRLSGGLRQINYSADDKLASGGANHSTTSYLAPALGGTFDLTKSFSLYGSYVKSLDQTGQAPINSANAFAVLPPAAATQKEAGVRANGRHGFEATLGYFTIDRANATTDLVTKIYAINGTNSFRGLESTLKANVAPRWTLTMGGQLMNATEHAAGDPTIDGKIPENVPRLSGAVGLDYRFRAVPGLRLNAGVQYVGARQINPQDQGTIPSVTTSSVGASYDTRINARQVTVNLTCRNLTDKRYYSSAVNGALGIAAPRTVSLSVRVAALP